MGNSISIHSIKYSERRPSGPADFPLFKCFTATRTSSSVISELNIKFSISSLGPLFILPIIEHQCKLFLSEKVEENVNTNPFYIYDAVSTLH